MIVVDTTASDLRALRGLTQRGGGLLTAAKVVKLTSLGLVVYADDYAETYPEAPPHYRLTLAGRALLRERGLVPTGR